ncbi:MAG: carboxypeptidase regulatory-like domain-containing protein, partial [Actinomycetota bacterium]
MSHHRGITRALACAVIAFASSLATANPAVDRGVAWLAQQTQSGGTVNGEAASIATAFQARTETLSTLKQLGTPPQSLSDLVAGEAEDSTEYLARKIAALAPLGRDVTASLATLGTLQNSDGGFGGAAGYQSNPLDTAFALLALKAGGASSSAAASNAIAYLKTAQAADGSFAINEQPSVYITAYALQAFDAYATSIPLTVPMQSAKTWLVSRQAAGAYASLLENAISAIALTGATTDTSSFAGLQAAISGAQSADGSWTSASGNPSDPYLTAISIRALAATGTPPPPSTTATVAGTVVDNASGTPIAGALVQASGPTSLSTTTGSTGTFQLAGLAPGAYTIQVSSAGYAAASLGVSATAGVTSSLGTIRLSASGTTATLQGVVRDGATGQPVTGATVAVAGGGTAQTDASGAYSIAAISPGSAAVTVSKSGYQPISVTASFAAGATLGFSPSLYTTGATIGATTLTLKVVSSSTQQPISGATVTAGSATAVTDAGGNATLSGLSQGNVTLQASASGFVSQSASALLAPGPNAGPTLSLAAQTQSIKLSGKVSDSATSAGIGGATVRIQNTALSATTDASGQYQLFGITSLQFTVTVSAPGYAGKTASVTLSQLADSTLDMALDKVQSAGLVVTSTTTGLATYMPFGDIEVSMAILNSTAASPTLTFAATVFDSNGTPQLYTSGTPFVVNANGPTTVEIDIHNTSQPAGTYSVVVQGVDANGVVQVEGSASFAIAALARISGGVILDPPVAQAGATQPISINASISNHGNVTVPAGQMELTVTLDAADPSYSPLGQATTGPPIASGSPLNRPVGAVYDAQGVLWILNGNDGKILRVTPQAGGKFITETWLDPVTLLPSSPFPNPFPNPVGLTIDAAGFLYVLNSSTTIFKVDPTKVDLNSKVAAKITTNRTSQTAISSNGSNLLYVGVDGGQAGSSIFSIDVNNQAIAPVIGSGFTQPAGVAVAPDGTTYVSSSGNNTIVKVSPAGEVSTFIASGLSGPRGLALTPAGDLLIANSGTNTILKAPTSSTPTPPFPIYSSGPNLLSPSVVALRSDGTLYVGNTASGQNSIVTVPPGGGAAQPFVKSLVSNATAMTYDAAGNLYTVGSAGEVVKLDAAGTISTLASTPGAVSVAAISTGLVVGTGNGSLVPFPSNGTDVVTGLQSPSALASGGGTLVYVAERSGNRISLVDMADKSRTTIATSFVNSGDDLYFAPNGDRYVLNATRIDVVGATSGSTLPSSGLTFGAQSFAPNPAGGFYIEEGSDLKKMSAAGVVTALNTTPVLPFSLAIGIVFDNSGNLLVGDRSARKILRVNPATGALDTFADLSAFSTSSLWVITSDGSGGLFAAISDGKIIRVPSTGGNPSLLTTIAGLTPFRLAFDPAGNVLYAKTGSDVRSINLSTPSQVTTLPIPGSSAGALAFANGLIQVSNGNAEIRSYTPQGVLVSTLAGFNQPQAIAWDGTRIIVADASKTISVVPGQLPQTLADETVLALTLSGGNIYGTRGSVIYTLVPGARVYTSYFAGTGLGLTTLSAIAARPAGGFSFSSRDDQRILTIDASQSVIASYAGVNSPTGIAIDGSGQVYVASGFRQITKIDPVTRQSVVFDTFIDSSGLAVYNGQLLSAAGGRLFSYAANGARTQVFVDANAGFGSMVTANNAVYLTDSGQLKVSRWDGSTMTSFASGLTGLNALRYAADGGIYVGGRFGSLTRVANGKILQLAPDLGSITAVTTGPSGRIYAGSSLSYLTAFEPGTFKRSDISNLAQLVGNSSSTAIQYIAADAAEVLASGLGTSPIEVYRLTYSPPPTPPVAGTVVFRTQVAVADLPVGGIPLGASFGTWPIPFPGDFSFSVHRLDAVTGEAVNALHVGPSASGIVTIGATKVPPGNPSVRVTTRVTGGDFVSTARVDSSRTGLVVNSNINPRSMGADALGRVYLGSGSQVFRTKASGGIESIWFSPNGGTSGVGMVPIDNNQNFYAIGGPGSKEIYGISSTTLQQVSHDTLPEQVISIVRDSQDTIWALTIFVGSGFEGHLYRLIPGHPAVLVQTAPIRNPYSLTIDGRDNVYIQTNGGPANGGIMRVARDGTSSIVVGADASGDPIFEFEGVAMAGDCADNIFVTPLSWKKYGQGAGWAFPQFEEEHVLIQVNGTTGKVAQAFDGVQFSTDLSDMDGIVYDRFGGQILVYSERWITGGTSVIYRMPVTCGNISTDLHVVVPPGQATSGYSLAPNSIVPRADGSKELIWSVQDVSTAGKSVTFDTALATLALGEKRAVATEAFLQFQDTFTSTPVKVPLALPSVTADGLVDVGVAVSPSSYPANTAISGSVTLTSRDASAAHTDTLTVTVTDAQGALVTQVAQQSVTIPAGGSIPVPVAFNTGTYLSGSYLVKAVLTDPASGIAVASSSAGFDILADAVTAIASISANKQNYQAIDTVTLDARAKNVSVNAIASDLSVAVVVRDPAGNVMLSDSRTVSALVPGALQDAFFQLRLNAAASGQYSAQVTLTRSGGAVVDTRTTNFSVLSTVDTGSGVQGSLQSVKFANAGDPIDFTASLVNGGNASIPSLVVDFTVVDPSTGVARFHQSASTILPVGGGVQPVHAAWDTTGVPAGTYIAAASVTFPATASFPGRTVALGQVTITIGALQGFTLAPKVDVTPGSIVDSNPVTIAGIVAPMAISVSSGGSYRIGTGAFTTAAGQVNAGDVVTVRVTASSANAATVSTTLTVGHTSATFSVTTVNVPADSTPDPISFIAQSNVALGAVVESNEQTVSGINVPVQVSVENGEYRVGAGGTWVTTPQMIGNGTVVAVRVHAAATAGTAATATLVVSSIRAPFTVTTTAFVPDTTVDPFTFAPKVDQPVNTLVASDPVTVSGINVDVPIRVAGGEYKVNTGTFTSADGTVKNGDSVVARVNSSTSYNTAKVANVTIAQLSTGFSVTTIATPKPVVTHAFGTAARVLVLVSSQRRTFIDGYLSSLGVDHKVVSDGDAFRSEMRCGLYNAYWISGGASKLTGTLAQEVREAVFRGDALIVDGAHETTNTVLDEALGVQFTSTATEPATVSITGSLFTTGSFGFSGGGQKFALAGAARQASFGTSTGDPAITTNTYGSGRAIELAFDFTGTLQAQSTSTQLRTLVQQVLAWLAPTPPVRFTADSVVPIVTTVQNPATVAQDVDVIATLPAGAVFVASSPAPQSTTATQATWHVSIPAGQSAAIAWSMRAPLTAASYTVQFQANRTAPDAVALPATSIALDVGSVDPATTQVVTALNALAITPAAERAARDRAVTSILAAQTKVGQGLYEDAIANYLSAGDDIGLVVSVPTAAQQVAVNQLMQEVERRWCRGGAGCSVGTATGSAYSLMVFGSASLSNGSATGPVGVGGATSLSSYTVASALSGDAARLVVGGSLTWSNGSVGQNGSGVIRVAGANSVSQNVGRREITTGTFEDWNALRTDQLARSDSFAAMSGAAATTAAGGAVNCTGTNAAWNVCTITAAQLNGAHTINLSYPAGASVLVNVTGAALVLTNGQTTFNGAPLQGSAAAKQVIFNLAQMGSLVVDGWGWGGTFLAPRASVTHRNSMIDGQAVFNTLSSTGSYACTGTFQGT